MPKDNFHAEFKHVLANVRFTHGKTQGIFFLSIKVGIEPSTCNLIMTALHLSDAHKVNFEVHVFAVTLMGPYLGCSIVITTHFREMTDIMTYSGYMQWNCSFLSGKPVKHTVRKSGFPVQSEGTYVTEVHPKFRNINPRNVTHSLISRNPSEWMLLVQISLLIVTFILLVSWVLPLMQITKEVDPHPRIVPRVNMWIVNGQHN